MESVPPPVDLPRPDGFDVHGAWVSEGSARCPDDLAASAPQNDEKTKQAKNGDS